MKQQCNDRISVWSVYEESLPVAMLVAKPVAKDATWMKPSGVCAIVFIFYIVYLSELLKYLCNGWRYPFDKKTTQNRFERPGLHTYCCLPCCFARQMEFNAHSKQTKIIHLFFDYYTFWSLIANKWTSFNGIKALLQATNYFFLAPAPHC